MSEKQVPIFIPAELELVEANHLACFRFHYHLQDPSKLPNAGELFTGLTLEQARDTVAFLQRYISREEISRATGASSQKH